MKAHSLPHDAVCVSFCMVIAPKRSLQRREVVPMSKQDLEILKRMIEKAILFAKDDDSATAKVVFYLVCAYEIVCELISNT